MTHRYVTPAGVAVQAQVDVVLQRNGQAVHEGRAGSDGVGVPGLSDLPGTESLYSTTCMNCII